MIIIGVIISIIFSKLLLNSYEEENVMKSMGNIYILQYGAYTNKKVLNENIKFLNDYLIYEIDNKYYVYLGIYTTLDNANRYKEILEKENIYAYIRNDYIIDDALLEKINILDKKANLSKKDSEMKSINKEILDFYRKSLIL